MRDLKALQNDRALLESMMERMMLVRKFEEAVFDLFGQGKVHGTTHLGIGEEATGVGTAFALKEDDYMLATHRGHGQAIAKGVDINAMMAEILAKASGTNLGRGGSMHIADFDKAVLGANGIVGASAPIACGVGLFISMNNIKDRICAVFFGDGSSNQGAVHEALNLAAVWRLPVMFVLIDNRYGMSTPLERAAHDTDLTKRAIPYGIKSFEADGNDVLAVYRTVCEAREFIVNGGGPALVVEHTYRTSGHSKSDGNQYRSKEEIACWKEHNPVARFTGVMLENGFTQADIDAIDLRAARQIEAAIAYGESCPAPTAENIEAAAYAE